MAADPFLTGLAAALLDVVRPVEAALSSPDSFGILMLRFGWTPPADPAYLQPLQAALDLTNKIQTMADAIDEIIVNQDVTADEVAALVTSASAIVNDLVSLTAAPAALPYPPLDSAAFWEDFARQLGNELLAQYLLLNHPGIYAPLHLAGVIDRALVPAGGQQYRIDHYETTLRWDRLGTLLTDPRSLAKQVYGWGGPLDTATLLDRLTRVLTAWGLPAGVRPSHHPLIPHYYAGQPPKNLDELHVPLLIDSVPGVGWIEFGALVLPIPPAPVPSTSPPDGILIGPYLFGAAAATIPLAGPFSLQLSGGLESADPVGLEIRPSGVGAVLTGAGTTFDATAELIGKPAEPWIIIGGSPGSHVEVAGVTLGFELKGLVTDPELSLVLSLAGLALVVDFSNADGFLQQILGSQPQRVDLSSEIRYSSKTGLGFSGQGQLAATIPVHLTIAGVLQLNTISVAVRPSSDGSAALDVGVTGGLTLGPIAVSVDKVGLQLRAKKAASGTGNLGNLDLQFGFKPPDGLGLAVDASVASGGGYIFLDPQKGEYAGVFVLAVDLPMLSVQVNVAGILDTKMPDGSPGFSLLFLLVATFDPGFELGFGFTLDGVGGLVGIGRRMDLDALRAAFKSHQLETIFFPPDAKTAIANAPQTISDLAAIFPVTEGHTVFGPVLALGWGTPGIVEAEFGGILELPSFRLALFGFFTIGLPTLDEPDPAAILVLLHIDILGEIDFQKQQLSIDGELYDSRIVEFPLSGQMALRLTWGAAPQFALSVGGINPQTQPPASLPSLNRLMMSLNSSDVSLNLSAYFAATSNSLQVGANLEVHASSAGFTVHGYLGFDALFTSSPFAFTADMYGGVDVLQGSSVLVSISLELTLTGPRPFHAHGDGSFHVLFFSVSVSVDLTIGDAGQAPPLPVTDVWPLLQKAWQDPRNWSATLPEGLDHAVSFAQAPTSGQTILVHPAGRLAAREKVVPLNFPFTLFGSAAPGDYGQFDVNPAHPPTLGGTAAPFEIQQDYFAPGQFQQGLSDQDKLSKPSYQLFDSVVVFGPTAVTPGNDSVLDVHYETYYVENPSIPASPSPLTYRPALDTQLALAGQGAPALSPARLTGRTKYAVPGSKSSITTSDLGYVIASTNTLQVNTGLSAPGGASQAVTEATLQAHLRDHPEDAGSFQVIPIHEAIP